MKDWEQDKTDLHLHLDGSLPWSVIPKLADLSDIEIDSASLKESFMVKKGCTSLEEYLKCFELPGRLLQTEECLSEAAQALIEDLYKEQVKTAEIRFAPQLHKRKGLRGEQIVESILDGIQKGLQECSGMKCGLILCMMTMGQHRENEETVELAGKYRSAGVVAIDRAGAESAESLENYRELFAKASKMDLPYTIHAGECGSFQNIETALDLGAARIGHGVAAAWSEHTMERLIRAEVPIEVCVTSNLQTCAIPHGKKHPVKELLDAGVRVTINTDNRTVSDTNLTKEYELLIREYGFTDADLIKVQEYAEKAAFPIN